MKKLASIPDNATLLRCLNSDDELSMVVRGHQCIEIALDNVIVESMPYRHENLITRLPFSFKVDLAIGLFSILPDCRPPILAVNVIRNNFAHDLSATITHKEVRDLYNCLPAYLRPKLTNSACDDPSASPDLCFVEIITVIFIHLQKLFEQLKDKHLWEQATQELVAETLASSTRPPDGGEGLRKINEQIKTKVDRLKKLSETT